MKNSIAVGFAAFIIGVVLGIYRHEVIGILTKSSIEKLKDELLLLENSETNHENLQTAKAILANAIRSAGNKNPELKELLQKELFTNYIVTNQTKLLEDIEKKYKNIRRSRFNRMSKSELLEYKSWLTSDNYTKMREDTNAAGVQTGKIFQDYSQELQKIVISEAKAMGQTK